MELKSREFIRLFLATNLLAACFTALFAWGGNTILTARHHEYSSNPATTARRVLQTQCCGCSLLEAQSSASFLPCPSREEFYEIHTSGRVELETSDKLCTLIEVTNKGFLKPVGRSYGNNDWEAAAGDYSSRVQFNCTTATSTCVVHLPELTDGAHYRMSSFHAPKYTAADEVARFLEQATFGATMAEIQSLAAAAGANDYDDSYFASWIHNQMMTLPATSHRAYFRRRTNARFPVASSVGAVTHACQKGTRYRKFAFSSKDAEQILTVTKVGDGDDDKMMSLSMDGFVRTIVEGPMVSVVEGGQVGASVEFVAGRYVFCGAPPENRIGGTVSLEHPDFGCLPIAFKDQPGNPAVEFSSSSTTTETLLPKTLIALDGNQAIPIDQQYFDSSMSIQELLVTTDLTDAACSSIGEPGNPVNPVFATFEGEYWIHDPRFELLDNTLEAPLVDGGASVVRETENFHSPDLKSARCANVARTFLNQDTCYLTTTASSASCDPGADVVGLNLPELLIPLDQNMIRAVFEESSAVAGASIYLYAIDGLRIENDYTVTPPCRQSSVSRWVSVNCADVGPSNLHPDSELAFAILLSAAVVSDANPHVVDVQILETAKSACAAVDADAVGFAVTDLEGNCWRNVHPDHLNVYDFTVWTQSHPGGAGPITRFAEQGHTTLVFPDWHEHDRWLRNQANFPKIGRFGDFVNYFTIPERWRTDAFNQAVGVDPEAFESTGINAPEPAGLVCGSPFEVANDPTLGGSAGRGAFDLYTRFSTTSTTTAFGKQKKTVWTMVTLQAEDQLRQRVAWALAQILVISTDDINNGRSRTESFMAYYDIFVRNAFGNYRDVLKEVAFNPLMSDMLTYRRGRSTAFVYEKEGTVEYADENFSREVLQLFTTGLHKLDVDGQILLDDAGEPIPVYTNDDIREYARVWTGFKGQYGRGNIETEGNVNRIDPMRIDEIWRDRFPKMGLDHRYIGDGVPLCADLPNQHFLSKGATYNLLGRSPLPRLHRDPKAWIQDERTLRLTLQPGGGLFEGLCGSQDAKSCQFEPVVVLEEDVPCDGLRVECSVDTIRTVEVADGVWYEYVPPPCVYRAFYNDAKLVARRKSQGRNLICADPLTQVASVACCPSNAPSFWGDGFWGERSSFATANDRCNGQLCTRTERPSCDKALSSVGSICTDNNYYWTSFQCKLRAKINRDGRVAIFHAAKDTDDENFVKHVQEDTKTLFRVDWNEPTAVMDLFSNCGAVVGCFESSDEYCMCDIAVNEEQVFFDGDSPSREEVLTELHFGAFDVGTGVSPDTSASSSEVMVFSPAGTMTRDSVLVVVDDAGVQRSRKNMRSTVVVGQGLSFRNPVHFMSLEDEEPYQAYHETDEAINHYFHHSNVAPFLALRFAQRFGISNPSNGFIERIATSFRTGTYSSEQNGSTVTFGTGEYGDLAATIACVLLDRESRSIALDNDSSHGSLKEPLIKVIGLLRSFEFQLFDGVPFLDFNSDLSSDIGEMAHEFTSVFSFFLPEHKAPGPVAHATLVSPEGQVTTGARMVSLVNGLMALIKYGLDPCYDGFGIQTGDGTYQCGRFAMGDYSRSGGHLTYSPQDGSSLLSTVGDLATIMTAGRLNSDSRQIIANIFASESNPLLALIKAQQVIVTTPEFHTTSLVRQSGLPRPPPEEPPPSSNPYKAVVHILLSGGVDSYNMLVPHMCSTANAEGQTLVQQYNSERGKIAFKDAERSRLINANWQPCTQFAIHKDLEIVETLYGEGGLAFFANVGTINVPVTKANYDSETKSQLFAHNTMQEEARKVDPYDAILGTGILGRLCDVLGKKGYNAKPITIDQATIATTGVAGEGPKELFVSSRGNKGFNPKPNDETFDPQPYLEEMNAATTLQSSVFGETWSSRLTRALVDNEATKEAFTTVELGQTFDSTLESKTFTERMKAVSNLILSHEHRGTDRDAIFVDLGGWDHHFNLKPRLSTKFRELNEALTFFVNEMKTRGHWGDVSVVITSDFGRTLSTNSGEGTDHGWGGNYFVMGGSVKGGQIHGQYPSDLTEAGPVNIGRGRLIPTLSWESMLSSVAQWMGTESEDELDYVFPNRHATGTRMFQKDEVFDG